MPRQLCASCLCPGKAAAAVSTPDSPPPGSRRSRAVPSAVRPIPNRYTRYSRPDWASRFFDVHGCSSILGFLARSGSGAASLRRVSEIMGQGGVAKVRRVGANESLRIEIILMRASGVRPLRPDTPARRVPHDSCRTRPYPGRAGKSGCAEWWRSENAGGA